MSKKSRVGLIDDEYEVLLTNLHAFLSAEPRGLDPLQRDDWWRRQDAISGEFYAKLDELVAETPTSIQDLSVFARRGLEQLRMDPECIISNPVESFLVALANGVIGLAEARAA
jgi:hypothetical protein